MIMNWLVWLGIAVVVAVVVALTGVKPRGTRHVSHTRLMGVGRIVLVVIIAIFAFIIYRAQRG